MAFNCARGINIIAVRFPRNRPRLVPINWLRFGLCPECETQAKIDAGCKEYEPAQMGISRGPGSPSEIGSALHPLHVSHSLPIHMRCPPNEPGCGCRDPIWSHSPTRCDSAGVTKGQRQR